MQASHKKFGNAANTAEHLSTTPIWSFFLDILYAKIQIEMVSYNFSLKCKLSEKKFPNSEFTYSLRGSVRDRFYTQK